MLCFRNSSPKRLCQWYAKTPGKKDSLCPLLLWWGVVSADVCKGVSVQFLFAIDNEVSDRLSSKKGAPKFSRPYTSCAYFWRVVNWRSNMTLEQRTKKRKVLRSKTRKNNFIYVLFRPRPLPSADQNRPMAAFRRTVPLVASFATDDRIWRRLWRWTAPVSFPS